MIEVARPAVGAAEAQEIGALRGPCCRVHTQLLQRLGNIALGGDSANAWLLKTPSDRPADLGVLGRARARIGVVWALSPYQVNAWFEPIS